MLNLGLGLFSAAAGRGFLVVASLAAKAGSFAFSPDQIASLAAITREEAFFIDLAAYCATFLPASVALLLGSFVLLRFPGQYAVFTKYSLIAYWCLKFNLIRTYRYATAATLAGLGFLVGTYHANLHYNPPTYNF